MRPDFGGRIVHSEFVHALHERGRCVKIIRGFGKSFSDRN